METNEEPEWTEDGLYSLLLAIHGLLDDPDCEVADPGAGPGLSEDGGVTAR